MTTHRFRPRYHGVAWGSIGFGGVLGAASAAVGFAALPMVSGAIGIVFGIAYLASPAWQLAIATDDDGIEVRDKKGLRFRLAWSDVRRVVASPSTKTCFVDGGVPEHSILVPVDGSENSDRAVKHAIEMVRHGYAQVLRLLNVQPPVGGAVATFVPKANIDGFHRDEGEKALASAVELCKAGGIKNETHISVGRAGAVVAEFAKRHGAVEIVAGTRGHTGLGGVLLGSVAQDIVAHATVPVCLVK